MATLPHNWVTDAPHDFEYKKYVLLAYLQHCRSQFGEARLYPPLADLVLHYRNLTGLKSGLEDMQDQFPKDLLGIDIRRLEMRYESCFNPEDYLSAITETIEFALPSVKDAIQEGKEIYDLVERHIEFSPVGIEPIYRDEGFLLINEEPDSDVFVYSFRYSIIPQTGETLRGLELNYLYSEQRSLVNQIEQIKLNLIKRFSEFPNPATFFCLSRLQVPLSETLLPVTRRLLMRRLAA